VKTCAIAVAKLDRLSRDVHFINGVIGRNVRPTRLSFVHGRNSDLRPSSTSSVARFRGGRMRNRFHLWASHACALHASIWSKRFLLLPVAMRITLTALPIAVGGAL
jgi:hypothetical protein